MNLRVLAVDDDPIFLEILRSAIPQSDIAFLTTANSGAEALALAQTIDVPFDCFLIDIVMPGMDGIELIQAVRAFPEYQQTAVLMMTMRTDSRAIDRAFAAGATDYLTKPLDREELLKSLGIVSRALERPKTMGLEQSQRTVPFNARKIKSFEAAKLEPCAKGMVELRAINNYQKALKAGNVFSHAVMGLNIENAHEFFTCLGPEGFHRVLHCVATAISDLLGHRDLVFAHAGGANFICVTASPISFDLESATLQLSRKSASLLTGVTDQPVPSPRISLGNVVSMSLFSLAHAAQTSAWMN